MRSAQLLKESPKELKPPADLATICEDVKVCGKRELYSLLRLRHKYQVLMEREVKEMKAEERKKREAIEGPREETDEDEKLDRELEETIKKIERDKKRQEKKDRVQTVKSDLRTKMSVIASTTIDNDEELYMSKKQWDNFREVVDDKPKKGKAKEESESDASDGSEQS